MMAAATTASAGVATPAAADMATATTAAADMTTPAPATYMGS
jgi:hypothetical protein